MKPGLGQTCCEAASFCVPSRAPTYGGINPSNDMKQSPLGEKKYHEPFRSKLNKSLLVFLSRIVRREGIDVDM